MKIVFIGVGKMARAMIEGWSVGEKDFQGEKREFFLFDHKDSNLKEYVSSLTKQEKQKKDEKQFHIFDDQKITDKDLDLLFGDFNNSQNKQSSVCGFLFLAVKPADLEKAISEHAKLISHCIANNFPIVSIMAGVKLEKIRKTIFENFDSNQNNYRPLRLAQSTIPKSASENFLIPTYWSLIRQDEATLDKSFSQAQFNSATKTLDLSYFNPPIIRLMPNLTVKYGFGTGAYCSYDDFSKEKVVFVSSKDSSKKISLALLEFCLNEMDKGISSITQPFINDLDQFFEKDFLDNLQRDQSKRNEFRKSLTNDAFSPIKNHQEKLLQILFEKLDTLLQPLGSFQKVIEEKMDIVTALAGSAPAFVAVFAEALSDAGVCHGLSRKDAAKMALQILQGTAKYIDCEKMHPAVFKDAVASPGGTTIEGLKTLEDKGFRSSVIEAITGALKRARNLSREKKYKGFFPVRRKN